MERKRNLFNCAHFLLAAGLIGSATGGNQCSNLQTDTTAKKCSETYIDSCNVFAMLNNIDNAQKGIQMKTQSQLRDLDKKVNSILQKLDPCSSNPCANGKCMKTGDDFVCTCEAGYFGKTCTNKITATDCYELRHRGNVTKSGVYQIQLWRSQIYIEVYCDMETDGGSWTVFQRRYNGDVDFYRNFKEYEIGFGDAYEEFWLGLQNIEELISKGTTELRIDLTGADDSYWFETYTDFRLSSTTEYYLNISMGYKSSGNSNFRMMLYNGYPFTTKDRDFDLEVQNDVKIDKEGDNSDDDDDDKTNCGVVNHSGWWHGYCKANHFANLNGEYCKPGDVSKINEGYGGFWYKDFKGLECLKTSKMMIRRV